MKNVIASHCPNCGAPKTGRKRFACGTDRAGNRSELCNLLAYHQKNRKVVEVDYPESMKKIAEDSITVSVLRNDLEHEKERVAVRDQKIIGLEELVEKQSGELVNAAGQTASALEQVKDLQTKLEAKDAEIAAYHEDPTRPSTWEEQASDAPMAPKPKKAARKKSEA